MMVLKDKCRKWYFVPELILLPWAHGKILELLHKSGDSSSAAENVIKSIKWLLGMSVAEFGEGTPESEVGPRGNVFPCIHQRLEAILDHGTDLRATQSWPTPDPGPSTARL